MNLNSIIREIEYQYDVEKIVSNNIPIWQFLRNIISDQPGDVKKINNLKKVYYLIKNKNWGNYRVSKKYKYVLFTDLREEVLENNQRFDKTSQNLIDLIVDDSIVVVNPSGKIHPHTSNYKYNHMSTSFFHYIRWKRGLVGSTKIENKNDLHLILKKYHIDIDVNYYNRLFFTYVDIFSNWLKDVSPKAVFINCYYSLFHQALIFACKQKKITCIEIQHGLISNFHIQYSPKKFIGNHTMPNFLLSYNDYVKTLTNKNYIKPENIVPVGHYYLEKKIKDKCKNHSLTSDKYKKIIVVSTQNSLQKELIQKIEDVAKIKGNVLFIIKTRDNRQVTSIYKNIKTSSQNIYSLIKKADMHISCYSTVALEASMMGTPTILININNMAKLYFDLIIKIYKNIEICDSTNEVIDKIDNWCPEKPANLPYALNNRERIKNFLESI
tara:strand:- start:9718 stop:11034 length:1317 start_codon:yes stop_codon:yes gene_type:complete